ncbi:MAG: hypothetical protein D3906_09575 [Candidatus Electrothrix sp. AUS1_2]|nr:hypothetical protein [Candidatus Electrothrix sp. AUS1_2]
MNGFVVGVIASLAAAFILENIPEIRKILKDYCAYIKIKIYTGREGKLFDSYTKLIIQSILKQDRSHFIDIPVDIKNL